jgi:large subunit ribosomal protein L29
LDDIILSPKLIWSRYKMAKKKDFNELSISQLDTILKDLKIEQRKLRFDSVVSTVENPAKIKMIRRDIARVKTIMKEMELGIREKKTIS